MKRWAGYMEVGSGRARNTGGTCSGYLRVGADRETAVAWRTAAEEADRPRGLRSADYLGKCRDVYM